MSLPRFTLHNFASLFVLFPRYTLANAMNCTGGCGRRWNGNPMAKRRRKKLKGWQKCRR